MRDIEEITHMLMHALTEESIEQDLEKVKSQQDAYKLLQTLPYFDLTIEEFKAGIMDMQSQQE